MTVPPASVLGPPPSVGGCPRATLLITTRAITVDDMLEGGTIDIAAGARLSVEASTDQSVYAYAAVRGRSPLVRLNGSDFDAVSVHLPDAI